MTTLVGFVSIESLLLVAAGLAAVGAVLTGVLVVRSGRSRPPADEDIARRRAPSPSSVGLADDPIVAAIGIAAQDGRRPRRVHHADQIEP